MCLVHLFFLRLFFFRIQVLSASQRLSHHSSRFPFCRSAARLLLHQYLCLAQRSRASARTSRCAFVCHHAKPIGKGSSERTERIGEKRKERICEIFHLNKKKRHPQETRRTDLVDISACSGLKRVAKLLFLLGITWVALRDASAPFLYVIWTQ